MPTVSRDRIDNIVPVIRDGSREVPFDGAPKGIAYGALGHYRVTVRAALVATQAANSRIFELRNTHASNLIVPTRIQISWVQTGAHTAAIENSLDLYKVTGFTALDTVNTVTPTPAVKRSGSMAPAGSSIAAVRHVTVAGAAAGMTGGTLTKNASALASLPKFLYAAQPSSGPVVDVADLCDGRAGSHPLVLSQNEGFIIENSTLLGAAAASSVYIDISWAEVSDY